MNSSALCSLLFTLCLILISHSPSEASAKKSRRGGGGVNINLICNGAMDKAGCLNILQSDPRIVNAKNFAQLSTVFLELAVNKAIEGQNFLKGLAQANNCPAISQCANFDYDGVVGSFRSALGELKDDPQTANYDAKAAGDGPATCDRGLAAAHVVNPDVSNLNRQISLLSEIAFLATNQLS